MVTIKDFYISYKAKHPTGNDRTVYLNHKNDEMILGHNFDDYKATYLIKVQKIYYERKKGIVGWGLIPTYSDWSQTKEETREYNVVLTKGETYTVINKEYEEETKKLDTNITVTLENVWNMAKNESVDLPPGGEIKTQIPFDWSWIWWIVGIIIVIAVIIVIYVVWKKGLFKKVAEVVK
ncbi:MAG: hypothetical protein AB1779_04865 [Candidatus Thermoplasmatota archaeon]